VRGWLTYPVTQGDTVRFIVGLRLIARGDHTIGCRLGGVYSYHGGDCGEGKVIHYTGNTPVRSKVRETSIEKFANGGEVQTRGYPRRALCNVVQDWS
jgi:hypothetical protein